MYFTSPLTCSNMLNLVDMPSSSAKLKSGTMAVKVSSSIVTGLEASRTADHSKKSKFDSDYLWFSG
jgi:hypothetical protein